MSKNILILIFISSISYGMRNTNCEPLIDVSGKQHFTEMNELPAPPPKKAKLHDQEKTKKQTKSHKHHKEEDTCHKFCCITCCIFSTLACCACDLVKRIFS